MRFISKFFFPFFLPFFLLVFVFYHKVYGLSPGEQEPVKVILDTDLDSDVDDVGALAMLLNLHEVCRIELAGVVVTSDDPWAPVCAASINAFFGYPDIPVGFLKNQEELNNHSRYTRQIAAEFPSGMNSWKEAEDAVKLYRRILAENRGEPVVILTIGHLSSLQGLLRSAADGISPLNGADLVKEKVKKWVCMGGHFPKGKEANFYRPDPRSTNYCVDHWEKDVVFCGWEVGNQIITGGNWLKEQLSPEHPVYRGYELYNGFSGRQSWDQIAVLQLIPEGKAFFSSVRGHCRVAPDGSNTWEDDETGPHRYVFIKPSVKTGQIRNFTDRLMAGLYE